MDSLRVRWWYGSLYLLVLVFSCFYETNGHQILPVREVVNKAMFINGNDNGYRSPILSAIDEIGPTEQLLFPFMNFTCSGSMTRLIFVARRSRAHQLNPDSRQNNVTSWPVFSLWYHAGGDFMERQPLGPMHPNQIVSVQPASRSMSGDSQEVFEVSMIDFMPPIQFEPGYVLGLRQYNSMSAQPNQYNITALRQRGGYGLALSCSDYVRCLAIDINIGSGHQEIPYIAIETTLSSQRCAMGFLNEQSLRMIVEASMNMYDNDFVSVPGIPHPAMSMPFTRSGALRKMVIAARFDVHLSVGWPELQIIRMANDGTPNIVFTTNTMEPKPIGYLNLYEYHLTPINFAIQVGDTMNISWHGNIQQPRFSLAYYHNGTSPAIPMVSIVVGDCDPETDLLTLHTLYYEDINVELPSSGITATQSGTVTEEYNSTALPVIVSIITSIVVLCSLLSIVVVILVIFVRQKKHKMNRPRSSMQESDSRSEFQPTSAEVIEMDMNEAYITNTIHTESNVAYSSCTPVVLDSTMPHDYDNVIV